MRSLWTLLIAVGVVVIAPVRAPAQSPEALLKQFKPSLKDVEFETPADPAAIAACKVEILRGGDKKAIGYALRDGQGKLLRKFLNTRGEPKLDQWSYYQDGFEVYRESDLNDDLNLDECRWLNAGGTRIARVKSFPAGKETWNIKVMGWKRISAEEASRVFVQALVSRDLGLLETVLASPEELEALGVPQGVRDKAAEAAAKRVEQVNALLRGLAGWTNQTTWNRLDGMMPHLIPAGPETGLKDDLLLYENAVIFPGSSNGQSAVEMAFLQAPEIVKIGETWKFVELPRAVDPKKPLVASEGGIRGEIFGAAAQGAAAGQDPKLEAALKALATYDAQHSGAVEKRAIAEFHVGRIPLLRTVIKQAKNPEDQLAYNKQVVDSLAAAYQVGLFPKGLEALDVLIAEGGKTGSYAAFRKVSAEFALRNDEGGNLMANQKKWMADLKDFIEKSPKSDETPDALLQLASANEFNAEEDDARKYYEHLVQAFPTSDPGKKAAGALKRLDIAGKPFALKGPNLKNELIDTAQYRGKTVLVVFWASWADPVRRDLPELLKTYQKHHDQGFEVVGVCLDNEAKELEQFLKANPLPWPQIFLPGGLEKNPLANEFGIIALPTMILVDGQGKVVDRTLRTAAELEKQLAKVLANNGPGVALGAAK